MFANMLYFKVREDELASFIEANEHVWPELVGRSEDYYDADIIPIGENEFVVIDTWESGLAEKEFMYDNSDELLTFSENYSFSKEVWLGALGKNHYAWDPASPD